MAVNVRDVPIRRFATVICAKSMTVIIQKDVYQKNNIYVVSKKA